MTTTSTDCIEKQIFLKAKQARVWRALTNAEEFSAWFGIDLKGQSFAPGRRVHALSGCAGHEGMKFQMDIVTVEPERLFSYRWNPYPVDPAVDYTQEEPTLVEFTLKEIDGGTLLTVVESGFDKVPVARRAEAFRMNDGGWQAQLENIEKYVDQP